MNLFGFWHRRRFRDVVRRQLLLFAEDNSQLVSTARTSLKAYHGESNPEDAQEHYAAYDDVSEDIEEFLFEMCERYSRTIDPEKKRHYVDEFHRQARGAYKDIIAHRHMDD